MIVYMICYAAGWMMARFGHDFLSGAVLLLAAVFLYYQDYRRSGNLIHLRGVFSAFWVGGQGLACLKLSELQVDWHWKTWLCFFLAFSAFWVSFEVLDRLFGEEERHVGSRHREKGYVQSILICMIVMTLVSAAAFLVEAVTLGYVPLFVKGVPHAYSEFHLTGVHYFTVSCVLVPALAVLYFLQGGSRILWKNATAVVLAVICLAIPMLCVSRFQLIFAVMLALFTFFAYYRKGRLWMAVTAVALLIPFYVILSIARSHDVAYLNGIFEMKNSQMPIFISQPYIYIANNYENFNCLVENLPAHTWGLRMLFPVWALTGLKFAFPHLVSFPIYVNKAELTTVTLFYDAFYDFGIIGVVVFAGILGAVCFMLVEQMKTMKNPIGCMIYGQFAIYMMLSFFTTWFSNPTTWFYLVMTGLMAGFCAIKRR